VCIDKHIPDESLELLHHGLYLCGVTTSEAVASQLVKLRMMVVIINLSTVTSVGE